MDSSIQKSIRKLYGNQADALLQHLDTLLATATLINQNSEDTTWYKHLHLYIIYPAGLHRHDQSALSRLSDHLEWVKELGCNAIHILPFMQSPQVDKGFDVSDYCSVRPDLGNLTQLKKVLETAQQLELKVFMDLVINHVSDQHDWFIQAQAGQEKYRNYFLVSKEKPQFLKKYHQDAAVWADYLVDGKKIKVNIAFPERVGPIPHWRQGTDGYWYYHTYTPQQPDLNWYNPDVFLEIARVLVYWAGLGFNFRLDAIPFIGKGAYKSPDKTNQRTYAITETLQYLAKTVNPECAFIIESFEKLDKVIDYFGTSNRRQSQLSYNFHLCTKLWVSIVKEDVRYLWEELLETNQIPTHAEWVNFLRNHDELSLAHLSDYLKNELSDVLLSRGRPFREAFGISGRTYSLLGNNEKRFIMAYFLLASLPGALGIPYGDEVGATNVSWDQLSQADQEDSRNINRGRLSLKTMNSRKGQRIFKKISSIIKNRKILRDYINIQPNRVFSKTLPSSVLALKYQSGSSKLYIFVNLSSTVKRCAVDLSHGQVVTHINNVLISENSIKLGGYAGVWIQV